MFPEPITLALSIAGKDLIFQLFTIKGLPSFDTYTLRGGEASVYHVERREFQFRVASADTKANSIVEGLQFKVTDGNYFYYFTIESVIPDITGWADIIAVYNREDLS
jgi:hypothetical protein